ncbi:MAG: hypothetical protein A2158_03770 [Chloroflexi bacterium RBG_13_46_14]|nr:MAG: hypothetical protein A2158_03770 [Chloroflexi bacterium RBG_13_46_14]
MNMKFWLYSGLLVLVLALVGVGIWFVLKPADKVEIPETDPWMVMDISYLEEGTQSQLTIYDDGTVIHWKDTGLPGALSPDPARTWRTGTLDSEEMDDLSEFLDTIGFNELDEYYLSSAVSANETVIIEDNYLKISVDNENTVTAHGYFTPLTSSQFYPLPDPLAELREKLDDIVANNTKETLIEELTTD